MKKDEVYKFKDQSFQERLNDMNERNKTFCSNWFTYLYKRAKIEYGDTITEEGM